MAENIEAEVLKQFIPTLVAAVSDCVQAVSEKCFSKGLISESISKRVLDRHLGTSEERASTLIHSVHKATKMDGSCFQIFLEVLDEELPRLIKEKLLSEMEKDLADRASVCKALIPLSQASRSVLLEDRLQCIQQQSSFLSRYEDSVSRHASASTQKSLFEETLQSRSEERGRLRASLDILMSKSYEASLNDEEIASTKNRLSLCETEMAGLRGRIEELECVIEEDGMRARRGRNTIRVETKRLFEEFSRQSQHQIVSALQDKEQEHKQILAEKEAEIRRKMQEETKIKDLEHKLALQEKEFRIKELELNLKQQETRSHLYNDPVTGPQWPGEYPRHTSDHVTTQGLQWPRTSPLHTSDPAATEGPQLPRVFPLYRSDSNPVAFVYILSSHHLPSLLQQLCEHATKWRDIGGALGFTQGELDTIQASPSLLSEAPNSWLCKMLSAWLEWAPGDGRGSIFKPTLEDLKDALRRANLRATADTLHS